MIHSIKELLRVMTPSRKIQVTLKIAKIPKDWMFFLYSDTFPIIIGKVSLLRSDHVYSPDFVHFNLRPFSFGFDGNIETKTGIVEYRSDYSKI